jgi:hypothetical protein
MQKQAERAQTAAAAAVQAAEHAQAGQRADADARHDAATVGMDADRASRPNEAQAAPYLSVFNTQPREESCACGRCGACTASIDLLHKEQRESRQVAKNPTAARLEASLGDALLADEQSAQQSDQTPIQIPPALLEREELYRNEREQNAWWLEGEEETEQGGGEGRDGPRKAQQRLRDVIKGLRGKLQFDPHMKGPCAFCKRRGHDIETCLARPRVEEEEGENATPLQRAKARFVKELCARPTRQAKDLEPRDETEGRMDTIAQAMKAGDEANEGNPWLGSNKRRDKLRRQLGYWWAIGADATVLHWIGFGVQLRFEREPERLYFNNHRSYEEHVAHVEKEHRTHLATGSFVKVDAREARVGNPLQVEINAKGKARMCSDDRFINSYIANYSFTQESLQQHVVHTVQRDMQMITTDVAQAYYQVALHKKTQPYLAWRHGGQWIMPTILVFGVKPAPFIFTKIMRPVLRYVRGMGISGSNCIDDNLWAEERSRMPEVVAIVQLLFGKLGWSFNDKCVFEPSTLALYNGMWIDSKRYEIRAPDEKIEATRRLAWTIWFAARDGERVQVRDLQKLAGRLQSIKLAVEGVAVWTRALYGAITQAQAEAGGYLHKDAKVRLGEAAMTDVWFWALRMSRACFNGQPMREPASTVQVTIQSDASDVGWGAHTQDGAEGGWQEKGELPAAMLGESSTVREVTGLLMATERRTEELKGKNVLIRMDSYPAIRNLINGGGPVEGLNELVREWWQWCRSNRVRPSYEWVPREENTLADELSKEAAQTHRLRPQTEHEIREWLEKMGAPGMHKTQWLRTRVQAPAFDKTAVRLHEMIRSRRPVCIVVARWPGQLWWKTLRTHSHASRYVGTARQALQGVQTTNEVHMEAHLILPKGHD